MTDLESTSPPKRPRGRPPVLRDACRVQIQLPAAELAAIDGLAKDCGLPRTALLRTWILDCLAKDKP